MAAFAGATSVVLAQDTTRADARSGSESDADGQAVRRADPYNARALYMASHACTERSNTPFPTCRGMRAHGIVNFQTTPSDYVSKLNSAAMGALDIRQGNFDVFGDYIYTNATANAGETAVISGPLDRRQFRLGLSTSARIAPGFGRPPQAIRSHGVTTPI